MFRICLITFLCIAVSMGHAFATIPSREYHDAFSSKKDTSVVISLNNVPGNQTIEARARLTKIKQRDGAAAEHYYFKWESPSGEIMKASLRPGNSMYGIDELSQFVEIRLEKLDNNSWKTIKSEKLTKDIGFDKSDNSFSISFLDSTLTINAGNNIPAPIITLRGKEYLTPSSVTFGNHGPVKVEGIVYEYIENPAPKLVTEWNEQSIHNKVASNPHGLEGYWEYLDRQNDTRYSRLGGHYRLALISDGEGGYLILYVSGAQVNETLWKTGMLKGRLRPTIFENNYNLEWYDSTMQLQSDETFAAVDQNAILSLNFPLLKTVIRFSRARKGK